MCQCWEKQCPEQRFLEKPFLLQVRQSLAQLSPGRQNLEKSFLVWQSLVILEE